MARSRRTTIVSVGIIVLMVISACSFLTQGTDSLDNESQGDNSVTDPNSSETTLAPSDLGSGDDPEDNFPLTPDPISVQVTLDEANMVKGSSRDGSSIYIEGETAEGTPFDLQLENKLYTVDADGNLVGAFETEVTVTPVSAIEGIPFSKGYLAAVQLGPEGLLMGWPGTLTLNVPGNVEDEILTGFAANGDGSDFHLFPVTGSYGEYNDTTVFYFNVMHFSLYGVAAVVQGEIESQAGHPPVSPSAQDEQELAPLLPIKGFNGFDDPAPLATKMQTQLMKSYSRLVKPGMNKLAATKCEQVSVTAREFSVWRAKVDKANQTVYFQSLIDKDGKALHDRFNECAKELCPVCMGDPAKGESDRKKFMSMMTLATFAEELALSLGYDDLGFWSELGNQCAEKAGVMPPGFRTGGDTMGGEGTVMTPTPLSCP
jgi:hypothetical protein